MTSHPSVKAPAKPEDEVREVLERALGDRRLAGVGSDTPLLRSGIITSIELVCVLVDIERHYGIQIPQSAAPTLSIRTILNAKGGEAIELHSEPKHRRGVLLDELNRVTRRPMVFLAAMIASFLILDFGVGRLVEGPFAGEYHEFADHGERLYAWSGSFSQDSFRFALLRHEIVTAPAAPGLRVAVFGDSGTVGSYVRADQAIPAGIERTLRAWGTPATVWNLAWYGRLLAKDFMLLEAIEDRPFDVAVFTISEDHIHRRINSRWVERYRHISFNWPLLAAFINRIPPDEQAPFREVLDRLRSADLRQGGPLRRFGHKHISLFSYQPFLQYLATVHWLPIRFQSAMRTEMTVIGSRRCALEEHPPRIRPHLTDPDLDHAQIDMLRSVIRLLQQRGVRTVLYVEPLGPHERRGERPSDNALTTASVISTLARETGSIFVDQTWALSAGDFIDTLNHFTPDANSRIGEALAEAIRSKP